MFGGRGRRVNYIEVRVGDIFRRVSFIYFISLALRLLVLGFGSLFFLVFLYCTVVFVCLFEKVVNSIVGLKGFSLLVSYVEYYS